MDVRDLCERAIQWTGRVVAGVRDDQLDCETPCADWDVRALGNHIIGNHWLFAGIASRAGAPPAMPADYMEGDRVGAYEEGAAATLAAWRREGALEETFDLPLGRRTGEETVRIAFVDNLVHGWDLAEATGQDTAIDPELAGAALEAAREIVNEDLRAMGLYKPEVPVPEGAPVHERLVAFLGRTP